MIFLASGFWDKRVKIINMLMQYEAHTSNTPHSLRSVECLAMWCSLSLSQSLHHSLIYSNQTCKSFFILTLIPGAAPVEICGGILLDMLLELWLVDPRHVKHCRDPHCLVTQHANT